MMMINVPWHFKVDACTGGEKKHTAGTIIHQYHYSEALSSKLNWLACLKLDLTIILISQPRGELIC